MNSWFGVVFVSIISYIVYIFIGKLVIVNLKISGTISLYFVLGYAICVLVFGVLNIPFQIYNLSLRGLAICYVLLLVVIMGRFLYVSVKKNLAREKYLQKRKIDKSFFFCTFIVGVQIIYVLFIGYDGSVWDSSYYTGNAVAAVYNDSLSRTNPYTGETIEFSWLNAFYGFEMHSAAMSIVFGMHPIIYIKRVVGILEILLYNAIAFNIGMELFNKDRKKTIMGLFFLLLINRNTTSVYFPSNFLFTRAAEPKSMLANVGIPAVLLALIWVNKNSYEKKYWIILSVVSIFALSFAQTGAFLIPVLITAGVVPIVIKEKKRILDYLLSIVPSLFFLLIVLLNRG